MTTRIFEDSGLDPEHCKQGYYQVGRKLFNKKFNALLEASNTKQPVGWDFNQTVFAKQATMPRLDVPLPELYKQRALQLRDKYDYLILAYSGGADSDNILKVFQQNKINLNEVWCDWPSSLVEKSNYVISNGTNPENMPVEWFRVVKPALDELAITNPEIFIHVSDAFEGQALEDAEDSMTVVSAPQVYTSIKRYRYITQYMKKFEDRGQRIALVMGIDKVSPTRRGNQYGFKFNDNATFFKTRAQGNEYCNVEYFYWTPDFPAIVTEQAHLVWDRLLLDPVDTQAKLDLKGREWQQRKKGFDHTITKVCYPHWNFNKIQVDKSNVFFNNHFDTLTQQFQKERFYQSWASCARNAIGQLDPAIAFNDKTTIKSEMVMFSNFHSIGTIPW